MSSRHRIAPTAVTSLLLAGTALLTVASVSSTSHAATATEGVFRMAQAAPADNADQRRRQPPRGPGHEAPKPQHAPAARPAPPKPPAPAAQPRPPHAPAAQPQRPTAQPPRGPAVQERRQPPAMQRPQAPAVQRPQPPAHPTQAPAARPQQPQATPPTAQPPGRRPPPPAAQERREPPNAPATQERRGPPNGPAARQPQPQIAPSTVQPQRGAPPAAGQQPPGGPAMRGPNPAMMTPQGQPPRPRDAREFIRRDGQSPAPKIDQLRQERKETREGNRTFIREGDRTIIRQDNRTIIRHDDANRFAIGSRDVRVERRGGHRETIVERPNGVRIINVIDDNGRLLRRMRRDRDGRDVIIINNDYSRPRAGNFFIALPPPVIRIPRNHYIVDADDAGYDTIYGAFTAPPVEALPERYTLDQVRYSAAIRDRMPRVDLDINFDTGSWQLTPDQVDRLAVIARALNNTIQRNPSEVFMIEGHTDAVGNDEDNLSLSDRRAEAVAVALTEQFQVPPENLVTQGYGEQYLKVQTGGPERANRRVAVRRITPLIEQQAGAAPPR
ncbi:MAG: OmpA family protein [Rhizobiales bacterium]|nr:OmpA family protein [Hyphomicrobiales bacterium]